MTEERAGRKDQQTSDDFKLGKPALVCRWRIQNRKLPMANRHLRALGAREANGSRITPELVAWAKQHVEWTLDEGATDHPDGVLMLIVDEGGQAAMAVGDYEPLESATFKSILARARAAAVEAEKTGVAPETLWLVRDGGLLWDMAGSTASGAATLIEDLAGTIGMPVERSHDLFAKLRDDEVSFDEAFLVSDEHGVVPASDKSGEVSRRFAEGYAKLLASTRKK